MAIALVYHNDKDNHCFFDLSSALFDMTHAGQESHWRAVSDGMHIDKMNSSGILDIMDYNEIPGYVGVGRNSSKPGVKPVFSYANGLGEFALAFDGFLINGEDLRERYGGRVDADVAARLIADAGSFENGVENLVDAAKGHFCMAVATDRGESYVTRSPNGVRPLVYGEGPAGSAAVTESRALVNMGMQRVRDVKNGEIATIDDSGIHTIKQLGGKLHICSFLWPYYQMIDCVTEGIPVADVKYRIGDVLGSLDRAAGLGVDIVSPVPESGTGYEEGYANAYGCPSSRALIKYQYAGRSYDRPTQDYRDRIAGMKLSVVPSRVEGKRITITEDSVRRGTQIVRPMGPLARLREAKPKELHLRVCTPRNDWCCECSPPDGDSYQNELLASNRFPDDVAFANHLKVDSVSFITVYDFVQSVIKGSHLRREDLCLGCYTGEFDFLN